jgi:Tfp pilus assembly protein PilV
MSRRSSESVGDGEAGMTLAEVLVAVSIMSIAVITLVSAVMAAQTGSDYHRKSSEADLVARQYAEAIDAKVTFANGYVPCQTVYTASSYRLPDGWPTAPTATVTHVWNGTSFVPRAGCTAATDKGMQQISVVANFPEQRHAGTDSESFTFVVRKP